MLVPKHSPGLTKRRAVGRSRLWSLDQQRQARRSTAMRRIPTPSWLLGPGSSYTVSPSTGRRGRMRARRGHPCGRVDAPASPAASPSGSGSTSPGHGTARAHERHQPVAQAVPGASPPTVRADDPHLRWAAVDSLLHPWRPRLLVPSYESARLAATVPSPARTPLALCMYVRPASVAIISWR
jgi:hypothetical protein